MNDKIDFSELVSIVAEQTQLEVSIVEHFVGQLFKEIEAELIANSVAKIPGLGTFKVVKGSISSTSRIVFIADFRRLREGVSRSSVRSGAVTKETVSRFEEKRKIEEPKVQEESEKEVIEEVIPEEIQDENLTSDDVVEEITTTYLETEDIKEGIVVNAIANEDKEPEKQNDTKLEQEKQNEEQRLKRLKNERVIVSRGKGLDFDEDLNFKLEQNIKKKNRKVWAIFVSLFLLVALIVGVYTFYTHPSSFDEPQIPVVGEDEKPAFVQLENTDKEVFIAIVKPLKRVSIQKISEFYYKDNVYWPYIFEANKDNIENILDIHPETIVKIPRIDSILEAKEDGKKAARELSSKLLSEIEARKKHN